MSLPLTPQILEAAYEYMRSTPPFKGWALPAAEEVEFRVIAARGYEAEHCKYRYVDHHCIDVSTNRIGYTASLLIAMGHEMIHLKQSKSKSETKGAQHNAEFRRLGRLVCRYHGFDPKTFV